MAAAAAPQSEEKHDAETVTAQPLGIPPSSRAASGPPSQLWTQFSSIVDRRPVASAWAALPYRFELLLFVMAAAVRYWKITYPDSVVFDEYHFGAFVGNYYTGHYFFDIHPPLGKLTLMWVGWLFGYDNEVCSYSAIHDTYDPECKYYILRYIAGACGVWVWLG